MIEYVEVEEPNELKRLAKVLVATIKAELTYPETRDIGDPSGTYRRKVYFQPGTNTDALYWSGHLVRDRMVARNLFGFGEPGGSAQLLIWLEFNVPVTTFSRSFGGAFLRHTPTNRIVLAHRGIVTLGHSRVRKSIVFRDMDATVREVETSKGVRDFLLIGELDSSTLVEDLISFIKALRRFVQQRGVPAGSPRENTAKAPTGFAAKLRDYFEEFSGARTISPRKQAVADCYHGAVIRALRAEYESAPQVLKSREVDLTVLTSKAALLFEAKTSATPQDIYTAIGQLTAHAPVVAGYAKRQPVAKVIVLPEEPSKRFAQLLSEDLNIRVVIFHRSAQGHITFKGLDTLG
jgi:hypothetical protein